MRIGYAVLVVCTRHVWVHGGMRSGRTCNFQVGLSHTLAGATKRAAKVLRALEKRRIRKG